MDLGKLDGEFVFWCLLAFQELLDGQALIHLTLDHGSGSSLHIGDSRVCHEKEADWPMFL
ncbi:hypothetical protein GCM10010411_75230 [Actinomadura fulvescens]|uniref:Uncharacterized protein n=1 Tax=Actinomadura fulvescens TaxID=46160 RepID=A0ABP6CYY9_9ACTN